MKQKVFFIKTFGCQMNVRDSEIMAQTLSGLGFIEGNELEKADVVILNTCSIRAKAEQKVLSLLGYLKKTKHNNPSMQICVSGCVAQQEGARLIERMPHVDLVIGTQHIYRLPELLSEAAVSGSLVITDLQDGYEIPIFLPKFPHLRDKQNNSPSSQASFQTLSRFVTIMQGCNNYCAYCVVPYTRGREISRNIDEIIDEVKLLVDSGIKEITLLGQNVNSYGKTNQVTKDGSSVCFADLLQKISVIKGLARLRFTTSNPKDLTEDLMKSFRNIDNLCPQFHLPVQCGSDRILKAMNRKYTVKHYLDKVNVLREYVPSIALTTDVIVGFPGESDEDFEGTMTLLETVRFHGSFSFKYSDRPGTTAIGLPDKVKEEIKTARLSRFQKRQDQISLERNREYIGQTKKVMIEACSHSGSKGRTDTNHIVHFEDCGAFSPGDIVSMQITGAGQHSLQGEISKHL